VFWFIFLNYCTKVLYLINLILSLKTLTVLQHYNTSVSTSQPQIVGQSLTLECSVTTVRGITSRVDIVWKTAGTEVGKSEGIKVIYTESNLALYMAYYTIPQLSTTDDGTVYQCEVVINTSPPVTDSNKIILNVTGLLNE